MPIGPFLLFGDSTGDNLLIAREDYVSQRFNKISFNMQTLSREEFWSGRWLDSFMRYRGFEAFWAGLKADSLSETTGIGRAKRISPDWWLFEAESGEYSLVQNRDTKKWILP